VLVGGDLRRLEDLRWSSIEYDPEHDIAAVFLNDFSLNRCLPQSSLDISRVPKAATVMGYLARDFKRSKTEGRVSPRVSIYANKVHSLDEGTVRFHYPRKRNVDASSGRPVVAPIPRGLSGGPIVDTARLYEGEVRVVGVFCGLANGFAYGAGASKVKALLDNLADDH
jgi:hypothetical protein